MAEHRAPGGLSGKIPTRRKFEVAIGALFRADGCWALFRVERGRAKLVPVRVGLRGEAEVQVTEGATEGDLVVLHPSDRVADGTAVTKRNQGR